MLEGVCDDGSFLATSFPADTSFEFG